MSRLFAAACLAWLLMGMAHAGTDPMELVRNTTQEMLSALEAKRDMVREQPEQIYGLVQEIVVPHFDFDTMARSVLGKYWRRADTDQRARFVREFRMLLVRTYASSLAEYSDEEVVYVSSRLRDDGARALVRTEIRQPSGFPVPVDYELELQDGAWKVVGVTIDNLDLVLNYRSSFGTEIRQLGLDAVIDKLAERNRQASR